MEGLQLAAIVLGVLSPIVSAVWVVASLRGEIRAVKENVDRHEIELRELRRIGAL